MNSFTTSPILAGRWGNLISGGAQEAQSRPTFEQFLSRIPKEYRDKMDVNSLYGTFATQEAIGSLNKPQYSIEELEGLREREARRAQEIGKESLRETMKAKMFYDLPGNVAKAFSGPASIYYAGMSQVPSVYNQAVQAFRPLSLTSTSVVTPGAVPSYFS